MATSRRQPTRQARTNPSRNITNIQQARSSGLALEDDGVDAQDEAPGFCPALTHFTDSISALPKEMIRQYTGIKEADGKLWKNKDTLEQLITQAMKLPKTYRKAHKSVDAQEIPTGNGHTISQADRLPATHQSSFLTNIQSSVGSPDHRRLLLANIKKTVNDMLNPLDEKVLFIQNAVGRLEHELSRCEESYPYIANEVSEEARLGSMTHWALVDRTTDKKSTIEGGRTRLATTNIAANLDLDAPAGRSEARREAVAARKQRNQQLDSDFDDVRVGAKRGISGKGRRAEGSMAANTTGSDLGISNGISAGPNKRRKIEKGPTAATSVLMERGATASMFGSNMGSKGSGNSKDTVALDGGKKRGRASAVANGATRRRNNTNTSVAATPNLASSPVTSSFAAKEVPHKSPAIGIQRAQPSRGRQNSTQVAVQESNNRPSSSTSAPVTNGNGLHGTSADLREVPGLTGRSMNDVKNSMKEAVNDQGEHLIEDVTAGDGAGDLRGGIVVGTRTSERGAKKEEVQSESRQHSTDRPPSISTRGGGKNSKTTTPVNTSFAEAGRSRLARAADQVPIKRSHKKGAGIAAQLAAARTAAYEDQAEMVPKEDEEEDADGEKYCYCNKGSYGAMIGCDGKNCTRSWFHLECVGLNKAPKNATWYCKDCKEELRASGYNT